MPMKLDRLHSASHCFLFPRSDSAVRNISFRQKSIPGHGICIQRRPAGLHQLALQERHWNRRGARKDFFQTAG